MRKGISLKGTNLKSKMVILIISFLVTAVLLPVTTLSISGTEGDMTKTKAMISVDISSTPTPGAPVTYKDVTVNITNLRVRSGETYEFINCNINFQNAGSQMVIENGGTVNITGSLAPPFFKSNITSKSRVGYVIKALNGSTLNIERTNISAPTSALTYPAMMMLHEGRINASWISDLNNHIRILQSGVTLTNSVIWGGGAGASLVVDTNHTWSNVPTLIKNVQLKGRFTTALRVLNNSVWRPYDLLTSNIYYADSGTVELTFNWTVFNYVSPYIKVPHFVDSRSSQASLDFQYNDGAWKSFSGFPKSNTVFTEWVNADDGRISLTGTPYNTPMRLRFTAPDRGYGCAYIGMPLIGGQGKTETPLTSVITEAKMGAWQNNVVSTTSLIIEGVKVYNGTSYLLYSTSSGMTEIKGLDLGDSNVKHSCQTLAMVSDSGLTWVGGTLLGRTHTRTGLRVTTASLGNDWTYNRFRNLTINDTAVKFDQGVDLTGGWTELRNLVVDDSHYGVRSSAGLLNVDGIDIESDEFGMHITLPANYPLSARMDLNKVTARRGDFSRSGIYLKGTSLAYSIELYLTDCFLQSSTSNRFVRSDSMGIVTLDVTTTAAPKFLLRGELASGSGHGLAVTNWPTSTDIILQTLTIKNVPLDGIYLKNAQRIAGSSVNIRGSGGWGIYTRPYSDVNLTGAVQPKYLIDMNTEGGIYLAHHGTIFIKDMDIISNLGHGALLDTDCRGTIQGSRFATNTYHNLEVRDRSTVTLTQSEFTSSINGHGIMVTNAALNIKSASSSQQTKVESNALNGLKMVGGSLGGNYFKCSFNKGSGAYLESIQQLSIISLEASNNALDGMDVHVTSDSVVPPSSNYFNLSSATIRSNQGSGIVLTATPGVTAAIKVGLKSLKLDSNRVYDLISDPQYRLLWTMTSYDEAGSDTFAGKVVSDLDISVLPGNSPKMKNLNISLLGRNNVLNVGELATMNLKNCHIRPYSTTDRFTIRTGVGSRFLMDGGYLGYLDQFRSVGSSMIRLDTVLVSGGSGALSLEDSELDIKGSSFENIDGTALYLKNGKGNVSNTVFKDNQKGIEVSGVSQSLKVKGCYFIGNKWGIYMFSNKTKNVEVRDSTFTGNYPSPIYMDNAKATIIDSSITPNDIRVKGAEGDAIMKYTLSAEVLNEIGKNVKFNITIKRGNPTQITMVNGVTSVFSREFESYRIKDPDIPFQVGIDSSLVRTYVEVSYVDRTDIPNEHYSSDDITIDLTKRTHLTFEGFQTPVKTVFFNDNLLAYEDQGLVGGSVDISRWFEDIGRDKGNLTFTVTGQIPEITPYLMGDRLGIYLQDDWSGKGPVLVKATDPHGKSLMASITITVLPVNDPPVVSNVRITTSIGSPVPRTGDVLVASWDWYDVDLNDPQPTYQLIKWSLNGLHVKEYDNQRAIPDVISGQVWNFTITPADWHGLNYGDLGSPVSSAPIRIGNAPPTLSSITFAKRNPRTDQDLLVNPGAWSDPDSGTVTFHYLWEKRSGSAFVALGAPDSPVLESRFTKKGDEIRVSAWTFDGEDRSEIVTDSLVIRNSAPTIRSARLMPAVVDETTERVYLTDIVWADPDGDQVFLTFQWSLSGIPISVTDSSTPELMRSQAGWRYPDHQNISVSIVPEDYPDNEQGSPYLLSIRLTPKDTDGDGIPDLNDNDDDNDGWSDEKELILGSDPLNPFSTPLDTDRDGLPDGDALNSYVWMDTDDDNDGIPDSIDPYPKNAALPGDMDMDGIGDDRDPDIDGDGIPNKRDAYPYDPFRSKLPKEPTPWLQLLILFMVILMIAGAGALGYLIYNGTIKLPSSAPPQIESGEVEFEEELSSPKGKAEKDLEELEDLENMSVCSACGELIPLDAPTCPNCGVQFEEEFEGFEEDEE